MNTVYRHTISKKEEAGFALPSILFLITILSLAALSVVMLHYLERKAAMLDLARVHALYAAQSGISEFLAQQTSLANIAAGISTEYSFPYNSKATVVLSRWGCFFLVRSTGISGALRTNAAAVVGDHPSIDFNNALVFANPYHQLVCAGNTSITGNVTTGKGGVITGTLQGLQTPRTIPVQGKVSQQANIQLPQFRTAELLNEMSEWDKVIASAGINVSGDSTTLVLRGSPTILQPRMIAPSVAAVAINGDVVIQGQYIRTENPLTIAATGSVAFSDSARIRGLIKILAGKQITIAPNVEFDFPVVYSQSSIALLSDQVRAQLFAPSITFSSNAAARYPSVAVSAQLQSPHPPKNRIIMENGSRLEGTMLFLAPAADTGVVIVKEGAKLIGSLYSTAYITLDGSIDGTVITKEFYFYQSPTTYLGWLKSARINRTALPKSYLVPPGFSDSPKLDILDWL